MLENNKTTRKNNFTIQKIVSRWKSLISLEAIFILLKNRYNRFIQTKNERGISSC